MAGRGSFIESFPLFGYDLADYDELFAEKLDLLLRLRADEQVSWAGRLRAPLDAPASIRGRRRTAARVGRGRREPGLGGPCRPLGLPMALAIIGGMPERFAPFAEIHRRAALETDHAVPALSINSHGFIAATSQEASDAGWPQYSAMMAKIGRERGWPPMTREDFEASRTLRGANVVGSPQEVVEKSSSNTRSSGTSAFCST